MRGTIYLGLLGTELFVHLITQTLFIMRQSILTAIISAFFLPVFIQAQKVPDNLLNKLIKTYTDKGMTLEKSFLPNFNRAHPSEMMFYNVCYPGKKIVVATVIAQKPSDWYFKVSYGSQVAPKTHVLGEESFDGQPYYFDWIMTGFQADFSDPSAYCLTIVAYDKNAIDIPVYMYIFSKPL